MALIALITDTHYGARGDQVAFFQHMLWFWQHVFFPSLNKYGVNQIFHLGDLVDRRKYINFNTLNRLKKDFLDELVERDLKMTIIAGNHDCYHKNTTSLNAISSIIEPYQKNINAHYGPSLIQIGSRPVAMVPWITMESREETNQLLERAPENSIVFGHLELAGFSMNPGTVSDFGDPMSDFKKFDAVYTGHFHTKSDKDNIHYLGAPFQFNWGDYGDLRGFHILDTETLELTFIENPYSMFCRVIYDEDDAEGNQMALHSEMLERYVKVIVRNKTRQAEFEAFLQAIDAKMPLDLKVVETVQLSVDKDTFSGEETTSEIIRKYVQHIETPNQDKLESKILSLYERASVSE